jgi:hypothetical protein
MYWNKKTVEPWGYVFHYERLQLYVSTLLMPTHGYLLYLQPNLSWILYTFFSNAGQGRKLLIYRIKQIKII